MPFRFFQRIRIAPGLRLNLSKGGISLSAGPRGAQVTVGTSGTRATVGLPGSGLHYTVHNPHKKLFNAAASDGVASANTRESVSPQVPRPSWLERLSMSRDEKDFIDGWQAWETGDADAALQKFTAVQKDSPARVDVAWSAAVLEAQRDGFDQAIACLKRVSQNPVHLGKTFESHGFTPKLQVWVTPQVQALMVPTESSVRLLLAELQQIEGDSVAALQTLRQALRCDGSAQAVDPVMLAAFGELATEVGEPDAVHRFNVLAADIDNDTPVHTAVLFYRARSLFNQQLFDAALSVLTLALRRKKDRDPELLHDLRFLRGKTYEALNRRAQARRDFERIYAENPGFEGVRQALGLV